MMYLWDMPDKRTIQAASPQTGSYAAGTRRQLQGKASNKTQQYLAGMDTHDPGGQAFYREAITVPHPLEPGKTMSYGQFQDALQGPQKAAMLDAYARQNKMQSIPTAVAYQQAMFDQGHAAMLQRGADNPGELAFPASADEARRAPNTGRAIAHGNYVAPAGSAMQDAAAMSQRYGDVVGGSAYAAPGMAVQAQPAIAVAPARRVIRGGPVVVGR